MNGTLQQIICIGTQQDGELHFHFRNGNKTDDVPLKSVFSQVNFRLLIGKWIFQILLFFGKQQLVAAFQFLI